MHRSTIAYVFLALWAGLVMAGCIHTEPLPLPNASRADSAAVRAGVVYGGMDKNLARKALGAPESVSSSASRARWTYEFPVACGRSARVCTRRATLYIEGGEVTRLDNFPGYRTRP